MPSFFTSSQGMQFQISAFRSRRALAWVRASCFALSEVYCSAGRIRSSDGAAHATVATETDDTTNSATSRDRERPKCFFMRRLGCREGARGGDDRKVETLSCQRPTLGYVAVTER